ncbi:hypothetical protein [Sedimentitalea sp.]|uniref:hypothetical protein n=1 Tax=Sedimentitalea sp. TaxID=2048915 RepID=UPI003297E33D
MLEHPLEDYERWAKKPAEIAKLLHLFQHEIRSLAGKKHLTAEFGRELTDVLVVRFDSIEARLDAVSKGDTTAQAGRLIRDGKLASVRSLVDTINLHRAKTDGKPPRWTGL